MSAEHAHFMQLKEEGRERHFTLDNLFTVNKLNRPPPPQPPAITLFTEGGCQFSQRPWI